MAFVPSGEGPTLLALVFAAALVLLGAGLLYLNPRHRLNRLFVLFLVLRAGQILVGGVGWTGGRSDGLVLQVQELLFVAQVPALAAFGWAYHRHARGAPPQPAVITPLLALVVALPAIIIAYPSLVGGYGPGTGALVMSGPFWVFFPARNFLVAAIALLLARDFARHGPGPARRSVLLLSAGFALGPLVYSLDAVLRVGLLDGPIGPDRLPYAIHGVFVVAVIGIAALYPYLHARRSGDEAALAEGRAHVLLVLTAALSYAVLFAGGSLLGRTLGEVGGAAKDLGTLWMLMLPLLGAYALVRHQLFGLDLKVRVAVKGSTLAGVFLAVFFVVSESAAAFFEGQLGSESQWGTYLGIGAAGLLVFALAPLQRLADRVSRVAVPGVGPDAPASLEDAVALYRDQARFAWSDGVLDRSERAMLDRLRERLGLSRDLVSRLEEEASGR